MADTNRIGDAVEVAGDIHQVLLENDRVRVLEYRLMPGVRAELHTHPDGVTYHVEGEFIARTVGEDGEAREFDFVPGMCIWRPATATRFRVRRRRRGAGVAHRAALKRAVFGL